MNRAMKNSGVSWIGNIPEHWQASRVKFAVSTIGSGTTPDSRDPAFYNGEFNWIQSGDIYGVSKIVSTEKTITKLATESVQALKFYEKDFLVVAMYGASVGNVAISTIDSYANQACCCIKPNSRSDLQYMYYAFIAAQGALLEKASGGTQPNVNQIIIKNEAYLLLPLEEQKAIADFLDDKCGKIDKLISAEEQAIVELKEATRAVIRKYIKKGVYKNHTIIDSKSIWIGNKPESWKVLRGKNVLKLLTRPVLDTDEVITCFRDGEVTLRSNRREDGFTMSDKEIGYQGIEPNDLVIHGMDGFAGAIGISDSRGKGSPILNVCDTDENKKYIMYYLRCLAYDDVFLYLATGVRVRSCDLRWNKIADMDFAIPTREEQALIVERIENECSKIKELITLKQQKIAELKEYKKSLIYEYVTGKKQPPQGEK